MKCPTCGMSPGSIKPTRNITITKAGYLELARMRAERNRTWRTSSTTKTGSSTHTPSGTTERS